MILSYEHNKAVQADNSRAVRLVVSLSFNCTTRQTARELRLTAALYVKEKGMEIDRYTELKVVVDLVYDAAQTFIPVIVGYIFAYCTAIGVVWKDRKEHLDRHVLLLGKLSVFLSISSLGLWSGSMAFCIWAVQSASTYYLNLGQWCGRLGLILFFVAIVLGAWSAFRIVRQRDHI